MSFEKHEYDNGYIIEYEGEEIYRITGQRTYPNEGAAEAMIEETSVSSPTKDLLLAMFVSIHTEQHAGEEIEQS